ncbi:VQ motif-containing protein 31-like [Asparagus officinalis]|nr:VQ motif-containing protein 31-like [Asparagus officinalis]XP_020252118.1 VQ motif-containing protein 31-like [Asparagus officinalis]
MEKPSGPSSSPKARSPSTTFVETDPTTFKELVQRLTGPNYRSSAKTSPSTSSTALKPASVKRPTFKLQDRRQGRRQKLTIIRPNTPVVPLMGFTLSSPSGHHSTLISPSAYISGLKLSDEKCKKASSLGSDEEAEEKAIRERRFYLHRSPTASRPNSSEPELLTLFPLTSPSSKPVGP